jgi:hypothetical protein
MIIDVDDELLTTDECLAMTERVWGTIEAGLLQGFEDWAREAGYHEASIAGARDRFAQLLRHAWEGRRETAQAMLEAHVTQLH